VLLVFVLIPRRHPGCLLVVGVIVLPGVGLVLMPIARLLLLGGLVELLLLGACLGFSLLPSAFLPTADVFGSHLDLLRSGACWWGPRPRSVSRRGGRLCGGEVGVMVCLAIFGHGLDGRGLGSLAWRDGHGHAPWYRGRGARASWLPGAWPAGWGRCRRDGLGRGMWHGLLPAWWVGSMLVPGAGVVRRGSPDQALDWCWLPGARAAVGGRGKASQTGAGLWGRHDLGRLRVGAGQHGARRHRDGRRCPG
jgi:hypothetical protein